MYQPTIHQTINQKVIEEHKKLCFAWMRLIANIIYDFSDKSCDINYMYICMNSNVLWSTNHRWDERGLFVNGTIEMLARVIEIFEWTCSDAGKSAQIFWNIMTFFSNFLIQMRGWLSHLVTESVVFQFWNVIQREFLKFLSANKIQPGVTWNREFCPCKYFSSNSIWFVEFSKQNVHVYTSD